MLVNGNVDSSMDDNQIYYKVWVDYLSIPKLPWRKRSSLKKIKEFYPARYIWLFINVGIKANLFWQKRRYSDTSGLKQLMNTLFGHDESDDSVKELLHRVIYKPNPETNGNVP